MTCFLITYLSQCYFSWNGFPLKGTFHIALSLPHMLMNLPSSQPGLFFDLKISIPSISSPSPENMSPPSSLRRSSRQTRLAPYLADYHYSLQNQATSSKIIDHTDHLSVVISHYSLSPIHWIFSVGITTDFEPRTFFEATTHNSWRNAMTFDNTACKIIIHWS